jgi:hypothetical protein
VRRFTGIAAVVLMLVMMLPALACASSPRVNRVEQDCCQQMHGNCGEMAKQGCCRIEVGNDLNQLPARVTTLPVLPVHVTTLFHALSIALPASTGYLWHVPDEHSPPGLLISSITVLRI